MKRLLLIVNPKAGRMKVHGALFDIVERIEKHGYEVTIRVTQHRGHATEIAAAAEGFDRIACAGGDGTLNEVICGLLQRDDSIPLGYLPCGSTNDFGSSMSLPKNLLEAAENVAVGVPKGVDIGRFGDRYFSYVASFGAFTKASYSAPQNVKNVLGHFAYILEGIKDLSSIKPVHVRVETDEKTFEDDYILGAVTNSLSVAGIITLDANLVRMNDGKFEIMLIRFPQNPIQLNQIIQSLLSQNYNSDMMTFISTKRVVFHADPNLPWTLDGEQADGAETIEVQNLHQAIRILLPDKTEETI
jgi:YegS/Rv2252/BmrU family lipid kinase